MSSIIKQGLVAALESIEDLDSKALASKLDKNIKAIKTSRKTIDEQGVNIIHKNILGFLVVGNKFFSDIRGCEKDTIAFSKELETLVKSYYLNILDSVRKDSEAPSFNNHFSKLKSFNLLGNSNLVFEDTSSCHFKTNKLPYEKEAVKLASNKTPGIAAGLGITMGLGGLVIGGPVGGLVGAALGGYLGKSTVNPKRLDEVQGSRIASSNSVDNVVSFLENINHLEKSIKSIETVLNSLDKIDKENLVSDQINAIKSIKHLIVSSVEQFDGYLKLALKMTDDILE